MQQDWTRIISAGVGPIIVISACGLLCLAFYNRLAAVVSRLRAFQRERLNEQEDLARQRARGADGDQLAIVRHQEMLGMLQVQTEHVTRRARLIQQTLLCMLATIACLSVCSLCVGLSTIWPAMMFLAAPLFVFGLVLLLVGMGFAVLELRQSLDPIELESRFVTDIVDDFNKAI